MITKKYLDDLTFEIIESAIEVHKIKSGGLLENMYHKYLIEELKHRKMDFQTEMKIPLDYNGKSLDNDFRCDLFIENSKVLELEAVYDMSPVFETQLLTYMKLLKRPKGILVNYNCSHIFKEGQKIFLNAYFSELKKIQPPEILGKLYSCVVNKNKK